MGDHADALEFAGDAPSPTVLLVSSLKILAVTLPEVSTLPTSATTRRASSTTKAEIYELFRTSFGCPEEDGSLAASRSVSRCCSKGFAVSSIRDSGTAKTVHADVTGQWMFQKSAHRTRGKVRRWSVGHQRRTRPPGADGPSRPVTYYRSFLWGGPGRRDRWNSANQQLASMSLAPYPPLPAFFTQIDFLPT